MAATWLSIIALGAPVAAVALEPTDAALVEAVVQVVHSA